MLIEIAQGTAWEFLRCANNFLAHPGAPLWDSSSIFLKSLPLSNLNQISEPRCSHVAFYFTVFQEGLQLPSLTSETQSQANTKKDKLQIVTAAYQYLFYIQDFCFLSRKVHLKSWKHSSNTSVGLVTLRDLDSWNSSKERNHRESGSWQFSCLQTISSSLPHTSSTTLQIWLYIIIMYMSVS